MLEGSLGFDELDVGAVVLDGALLASPLILESGQTGEAPLVGDDDFLSAGEFVLGSPEGFEGLLDVLLLDPD